MEIWLGSGGSKPYHADSFHIFGHREHGSSPDVLQSEAHCVFCALSPMGCYEISLGDIAAGAGGDVKVLLATM